MFAVVFKPPRTLKFHGKKTENTLNDTCLEIRNISKSFGSLKAVDDISLSVKQGEIFGLCSRRCPHRVRGFDR